MGSYITGDYDWTNPWTSGSVTLIGPTNFFHPIGGWEVGARPSRIVVTFEVFSGTVDLAGSFVSDVAEDGAIGYPYPPGPAFFGVGIHSIEFPLVFVDSDILYLYISTGPIRSSPDMAVTNIAVDSFIPFWTSYVATSES